MGSFDYTCALSELSISAGDEVFLIALTKGHQGLNGGAFSQFDIAFPPIRARYDDYGFVDNAQPTPFHEAFAQAMGHPGSQALLDAIHDGSATTEKVDGALRIEFCLARADAWHAMLAMPCSWWGSQSELDAKDMLAPAAREGSRILARAPGILARIDLKPITESIEKGAYDRDRLAKMLMNTYLMEEVDHDGPFFTMFSDRLLGGYHGSELFVGASTLSVLALDMPRAMPHADAPSQGLEEALQTALIIHGETMVVSMAMNMVRKIWLPRDSGGPQFGAHALHWLWARKLAELASNRIEWDEDGRLDGFAQAKALRESDALGHACAPEPSAPPKTRRSKL